MAGSGSTSLGAIFLVNVPRCMKLKLGGIDILPIVESKDNSMKDLLKEETIRNGERVNVLINVIGG